MSNSFDVYFKDEKVAEELTKLHIKNLRRAAELADQVIEIVKQFDGKVLNVRFEKALKEKTGEHIVVRENYSTFSIDWYMDDRCVPSGDGCSVVYLDGMSISLCFISDYDNTKENMPIVNKRIVADNFIPDIKKQIESFLIDAGKLEESITKIGEWKARAKELTDQVNKLHNEIPYEIKDYYGLDIPWASISGR